MGYTELLRTRRLDAGLAVEILGTVHREAKRLSSLIDDFLDLQTIEERRLELVRAPFDMGALLEESVAVFAGQSEAHRLELTPCESPVTALGDRARVAQVIANLLSNAIKYSPDGGVVRVDATCADRCRAGGRGRRRAGHSARLRSRGSSRSSTGLPTA